VLVPVGLNYLMWSVSAVNIWFKLVPGSHKISGVCYIEVSHKRSSISCMFDFLRILRLFLCNLKHSVSTSIDVSDR
jgi:hypothetical protein